jgi:hypothetical protein
MAKYQDICPVCGGEFENYHGAARDYCSVACQIHNRKNWEACEHFNAEKMRRKCNPELWVKKENI